MRTPAGEVAIRVSNGRLQLIFRYNGKRECISVGLADTIENRRFAQIKANTLKMDLLSGNFDETHAKYKFQPDRPKPKAQPEKSQIKLMDLWLRYVDFKRSQNISPNTITKDYGSVTTFLQRCDHTEVSDAIAIRDWLLGTTTPNRTHRTLVQLSAACNWGVKSKIIDNNPFAGMAKEIKVEKKSKQIEYFTESERLQIIQYFKGTGSHYAAFVEFLMRSGCRPSEAIALQWKHVSEDCKTIIFEQTVVMGDRGWELKQGLKTQSYRRFSCGAKMAEFMRSIKPNDCDRNDLVLPSPQGKWIDLHNFTARDWRSALRALGLRYRSPYKMRHTMITHGLDTLDAKDIAELVGNSAMVIYSRYAGIKENLESPDF